MTIVAKLLTEDFVKKRVFLYIFSRFAFLHLSISHCLEKEKKRNYVHHEYKYIYLF